MIDGDDDYTKYDDDEANDERYEDDDDREYP